MEEKLKEFLGQLEQKLIHANSKEEAYALVNNYNKQSLEIIQDYLKAYTRSKNRHAIIASIVQCTYEAHHRRQIILNTDLKK